ncbi:MAG: TetR/AcrR family transcriptional regulator [Clostridia bacterium]|nr:TetR/AcrR family transcriptional regulator [Clostridia bacterium]
MDTRERIMDTALTLFAESGYEAVSIRDVCREVGIKESSVYYHFKNKRDILDSLLNRFEDHVNALLAVFRSASMTGETPPSFDWMDTYFFDQYLFDPFCNKLMRLMMIEQFHDEQIREAYERWLFTEPYRIETSAFLMLAKVGVIPEADAAQMGRNYYANITMLIFRHLLNGALTEERKDAFRTEAHAYINTIIKQLGGKENV